MGITQARLPLRQVIVVEMCAAAGLVVWALSSSPYGWVAPMTAALAALGAMRFTGGRAPGARVADRLRLGWSRTHRHADDVAPPPFDIGESGVGARWVGAELITAVRIAPNGVAPTYLTPGAAVVDEPGQLVPVELLAQCLNIFDISLASIDVIGHGVRTWGTSPVAGSYHRTLGPLPATAHRSVLVIIRLDPQRCAGAVAGRGGGTTGVLRTATIATRRIANRLSEKDLRTSILSAAQITQVTGQLAEGIPLGDLDEHRDSIGSRAVRFRSAAIDPTQLASVMSSVWANEALSTTVTLRLRRDAADGLEVAGVVRFAELPAAGRVVEQSPTGLIPLPGRQFDAMAASLPIAVSARMYRHLPRIRGGAAAEVVRCLAVPAGGCGQLLGADGTGRAVAMPLFGSAVGAITISGTMRLVAQVTLRAIAIGGSVTVYTTRPALWRGLIAAVGDPHLLALYDDGVAPAAGHRVMIVDGMPTPPAQPPHTQITVRRPEHASTPLPDAAVHIEQNLAAPHEILVTTPTRRLSVTMVATADEWHAVRG